MDVSKFFCVHLSNWMGHIFIYLPQIVFLRVKMWFKENLEFYKSVFEWSQTGSFLRRIRAIRIRRLEIINAQRRWVFVIQKPRSFCAYLPTPTDPPFIQFPCSEHEPLLDEERRAENSLSDGMMILGSAVGCSCAIGSAHRGQKHNTKNEPERGGGGISSERRSMCVFFNKSYIHIILMSLN